MADGREPRDAIAKRRHEAGVFDEGGGQLEKLGLFSGVRVDAAGATAKAINHGADDRFAHGWEHSNHGATDPPTTAVGRGYANPKQANQLRKTHGPGAITKFRRGQTIR